MSQNKKNKWVFCLNAELASSSRYNYLIFQKHMGEIFYLESDDSKYLMDDIMPEVNPIPKDDARSVWNDIAKMPDEYDLIMGTV
jgi:hypothetical protein